MVVYMCTRVSRSGQSGPRFARVGRGLANFRAQIYCRLNQIFKIFGDAGLASTLDGSRSFAFRFHLDRSRSFAFVCRGYLSVSRASVSHVRRSRSGHWSVILLSVAVNKCLVPSSVECAGVCL